jgi:Protein of unknown function (DUF2568)
MTTPTSPPPSTPPSTRSAALPPPLVTLALGVRFLTELALLAAVAWAGAARTRSIVLGVALGIAAAVVVAAMWGIWIAPASRRRLPDPARLILELVLFGAAAAGLVAVGRPVVAAVVGVVGAVTAAVVRFLPEQPARTAEAKAGTPASEVEPAQKPAAPAPDPARSSADAGAPPLRRPRGRDRARPRSQPRS